MSDCLELLQAASVDRYAIEREIGAGGVAMVLLAPDPPFEPVRRYPPFEALVEPRP